MSRKTGELPGKTGVKSLSKKMDNTRHGFNPHPGVSKTAGAFGKEEEPPHRRAPREAEIKAHGSASGSTRESKANPLGRMRRT